MEEFHKNEGYECEFVLVNDGSKDRTFEEIRRLGEKYPNVCGINLMRNFGQHNAFGSKDRTFEEIRRLGEKYPNVCGINLMRNFGQHNALMAGFRYTNGDFDLVKDEDKQTHPSQIFKLIISDSTML